MNIKGIVYFIKGLFYIKKFLAFIVVAVVGGIVYTVRNYDFSKLLYDC